MAPILFGLAIGVIVGALGGGGSILAVPVLVYVLGENWHAATSVSLAVVTAGALAGAGRHARAGHVCWRHACAFSCAASPGIVAGTLLGSLVSRDAFTAGFGIIMLAGARALWLSGRHDRPSKSEPADLRCPPTRPALCCASGASVGALTGFFGVGGGFLILPMLVRFLALPMRLAVGTSLVTVAVISLVALVAHILVGGVPVLSVTLIMSAACATGAIAGAALSCRLRPRELRVGFTGLVTAVATYLLFAATFLGGPPG